MEATDIAEQFATAWVRSDLDPTQWWTQIAPLCEDGFAQTLRTVDPALVPASKVTGPPRRVDSSADGLVVVEVPTDTGTLLVTVGVVAGERVVTGNDFIRSVTEQ